MKTAPDIILELEPLQNSVEPMPAMPRSAVSPETRSAAKSSLPGPMPAVVIGKLVGFDSSRTPLVDFPGNTSSVALTAHSMVVLNKHEVGCEVAVVFENGDAAKPVILGVFQQNAEVREESVSVSLDGEQITLSAKNEIVLRCGKASITLTRAGKVLINGEYLLSRSTGVNRIKGGSVQIN